MKVNEALADALAIEANGPIFGLMGDANMKWKGRDARDAKIAEPAQTLSAASLVAGIFQSLWRSAGHCAARTWRALHSRT